jgi:hypothetical protein
MEMYSSAVLMVALFCVAAILFRSAAAISAMARRFERKMSILVDTAMQTAVAYARHHKATR